MNYPIVCRMLGWIAIIVGGSMALSLPWAFPAFGEAEQFEARGFWSLVGAMVVSTILGSLLLWRGRKAKSLHLYRKESMAIVGLSWLMASALGALPFWFSDTSYQAGSSEEAILLDATDSMFESVSGFSGTGATVLTDLENATLVPRCILFWRSETHFLGGLGIMVLFVAVLGMGSAGKALMRTEMPGPSQKDVHARTQHAARAFAMIYLGLVAVLTLLLVLQRVSCFDALCHAFGTVATGGFSTYNKSVEHFQSVGIEMTIVVFMILACTNFTLLYYLMLRKPGMLFGDVEFRTYVIIMCLVAALVIGAGLAAGDFEGFGQAVRYGVFQVVSIMTNTGFGTRDFDQWNSLSRTLLVVLMFIGGCAGSTSCSVKVIRYVLLFKILRLELERAFHPSVVRPLRLGGEPVDNPELRREVPLYFALILVIFIAGWLALVAVEPDQTWQQDGRSSRDKVLDCGSAVAATLNGVGPGLGIVGEAENYAHLHPLSKLVLIAMMLLGRLEVFVVLALLAPRFWRSR